VVARLRSSDAIDRTPRDDGCHLDYFARVELLDITLDDALKLLETRLPHMVLL